jgi:hypothetical protein
MKAAVRRSATIPYVFINLYPAGNGRHPIVLRLVPERFKCFHPVHVGWDDGSVPGTMPVNGYFQRAMNRGIPGKNSSCEGHEVRTGREKNLHPAFTRGHAGSGTQSFESPPFRFSSLHRIAAGHFHRQ